MLSPCPRPGGTDTSRGQESEYRYGYLDAISEVDKQSIFRLGHVNLGMSAALIGSGMAFEYPLFYDAMMDNTSVGGFDRVLEMKLLYKGIHIHYLPILSQGREDTESEQFLQAAPPLAVRPVLQFL